MKASIFLTPALLAPLMLAAMPAAAQVMRPAEYVATAGASDLYERMSSQMVLQTTADPKVRAFAQMMIDEHGQSTAMVKDAAARSHVPAMPPVLTPAQAEMVAQLQAEQGSARDAAYLAQQKVAHGQALNVQKAYAMEGRAPALRSAAAAIVPVVEKHIDMLKTM